MPLSIWLLKGFYDNIPPQLEQAARIDGASRFQAFLRVVMPLSSPGIIATAIYTFIQAWNEYVYALTFLNSQGKLTLPVGLQRFFTEYATNWPGLMAAAFIMSVPVVVLFLILQTVFRARPHRRRGEGMIIARRSAHGAGEAQRRGEDATAAYRAVDHVSLAIEDGEFVALVGPSGCGKTTTLNLVAGLIELTGGDIFIGDRLVNDLDPKDRDIAMVFQNYALYPEQDRVPEPRLPAADAEDVARRDRKARFARPPRVLDITHLLDRRPRELSGGQQQRVALGRALVRDPLAFLMDEPLSNLDAKLRVQMRAELKRFHQELNATVIYVTHDQLEAVTMADKHGGDERRRPAAVRCARAGVRPAGEHLCCRALSAALR